MSHREHNYYALCKTSSVPFAFSHHEKADITKRCQEKSWQNRHKEMPHLHTGGKRFAEVNLNCGYTSNAGAWLFRYKNCIGSPRFCLEQRERSKTHTEGWQNASYLTKQVSRHIFKVIIVFKPRILQKQTMKRVTNLLPVGFFQLPRMCARDCDCISETVCGDFCTS